MSQYRNWNIKDLLYEQLQITAEISSRIATVESMENSFLTYNPNGKPEDYKNLIEEAIDILRKGLKQED